MATLAVCACPSRRPLIDLDQRDRLILISAREARVHEQIRMGWSEKKLPTPARVAHFADRMRARANFHNMSCGKSGARINDP